MDFRVQGLGFSLGLGIFFVVLFGIQGQGFGIRGEGSRVWVFELLLRLSCGFTVSRFRIETSGFSKPPGFSAEGLGFRCVRV